MGVGVAGDGGHIYIRALMDQIYTIKKEAFFHLSHSPAGHSYYSHRPDIPSAVQWT